jgi:hypothetical protein
VSKRPRVYGSSLKVRPLFTHNETTSVRSGESIERGEIETDGGGLFGRQLGREGGCGGMGCDVPDYDSNSIIIENLPNVSKRTPQEKKRAIYIYTHI